MVVPYTFQMDKRLLAVKERECFCKDFHLLYGIYFPYSKYVKYTFLAHNGIFSMAERIIEMQVFIEWHFSLSLFHINFSACLHGLFFFYTSSDLCIFERFVDFSLIRFHILYSLPIFMPGVNPKKRYGTRNVSQPSFSALLSILLSRNDNYSFNENIEFN